VLLPTGVFVPVVTLRSELEPAAGEAGLNEPFAPAGRPVRVKLTEPVKPLRAPTFTVYFAVPPGVTETLDGVADNVKSGGRVTSKVTAVVLVCDPLVPVIVTLLLLTGVLVVVITVRIELEPGVIEVGLKDGVAPDGKPLALRLTDPLNPLIPVTLTL
jgi:hypothetical protein